MEVGGWLVRRSLGGGGRLEVGGVLVKDYPKAKLAGQLMLAGIVIFSGSLYALVLSQIKILGAITPVGGLCFLLGWLWLAKVFWQTKNY